MAVDVFKLGSVEMLVLLFLREGDAHGYQLVQNLEKFSDGILTVKTASLYPILYKLQENGCVSSTEVYVEHASARTGRVSGRVRVVYHMEEPGYLRLEELLKEHEDFIKGCNSVLSKIGEVKENG